MRIAQYRELLEKEGSLILFPAEPLLMHAPHRGDPEAGPELGDMLIGAAECIELQRALTAWLELHCLIHPRWHQAYRMTNPGGPWLTQAQITTAADKLKDAEKVLRATIRDLMALQRR